MQRSLSFPIKLALQLLSITSRKRNKSTLAQPQLLVLPADTHVKAISVLQLSKIPILMSMSIGMLPNNVAEDLVQRDWLRNVSQGQVSRPTKLVYICEYRRFWR